MKIPTKKTENKENDLQEEMQVNVNLQQNINFKVSEVESAVYSPQNKNRSLERSNEKIQNFIAI